MADWKPRAKRIKKKMKILAAEAGISPQHLTQMVTGKVQNPWLRTVDKVEMALRDAEKKAGVR